MTVLDRIKRLLADNSVTYKISQHEAVYTSEEAANVRGCSLSSGAKALICQCGGETYMFVMPANRRLVSKSIRKELNAKKFRFASVEEVLALTGLKPGSIPPFGSLFNLPTWCDSGLADEDTINFNAGSHTTSVAMAYADYIKIESPRIFPFAELLR